MNCGDVLNWIDLFVLSWNPPFRFCFEISSNICISEHLFIVLNAIHGDGIELYRPLDYSVLLRLL